MRDDQGTAKTTQQHFVIGSAQPAPLPSVESRLAAIETQLIEIQRQIYNLAEFVRTLCSPPSE